MYVPVDVDMLGDKVNHYRAVVQLKKHKTEMIAGQHCSHKWQGVVPLLLVWQ